MKKPFYKRTWFIVLAVLMVIGIIGGGMSDTEDSDSPPVVQAEEPAPQEKDEVTTPEPEPAKEEVKAPEPKPEPAPAPVAPSETMGQKNAVGKAKDYLSFMAFSRSGLIHQLEFEGYSNEDATYAVDAVNPDFNEQAAKKAQDYLNSMSFSRDGLITQLEFEGFTNAQANYGADAVGY